MKIIYRLFRLVSKSKRSPSESKDYSSIHWRNGFIFWVILLVWAITEKNFLNFKFVVVMKS